MASSQLEFLLSKIREELTSLKFISAPAERAHKMASEALDLVRGAHPVAPPEPPKPEPPKPVDPEPKPDVPAKS